MRVELVKILQVACSSNGCPTLFTDGDDVVIQGYSVDQVRTGIQVPDGETLVRIPRSLLHDGAALLRTQG
jgi:hypothetical protein